MPKTTIQAMDPWELRVYTFDGQLDPENFLDWIREMDQYFGWYDISPQRQVKFAKMKLVESA